MKVQFPFSVFILFLIAVLGLSSCKTDTPKSTDTSVDIALKREPKMINPFLRPMATEREVYQYIFLPMADFHPETYELSPILLEAIPDGEEIEDGPYKGGTKYTLEFREEAKWDDGSPITGRDLEFSIKAIKHPKTGAANYRNYLGWISDVNVHNDNPKKVDIIFKEYYILAKELAVTMEVYPKYIYDENNATDEISVVQLNSDEAMRLVTENQKLADFADSFNSVKFSRDVVSGPGPYKIKDWITEQQIVLEKKENYWGENFDIPQLKANPEKIIFHMISDEPSVMSQLKEGNIDLYKNMGADAYFDLKKNETYGSQFQFYNPELMKLYYVAINNSKPELADPKVRRALAKLVDVDQLIEIMEKGLGNPTVGIMNAKKSYYNNGLKPIKVDVEGAKNLLATQGWADTNNDGSVDKKINGEQIEMDLDIHITGSELSKNLALLFQENAKKAGVKINIITKKYPDILKDDIKTRKYDLVPSVLSQSLALDDPYSKWHSDNDSPDDANTASYRSEAADKLIGQIRTTRNDKEREKYYKELQQVMYDDQPVIFLYNPQEKIILSNNWKGKPSLKRPGYFANTFTAQ